MIADQSGALPVSWDNGELWGELAFGLAKVGLAGVPIEQVADFISTAVPRYFECDISKDFSSLRGVFSDALLAQCEHNTGSLQGSQPQWIALRIATVEPSLHPPTVRIHLEIGVNGAADGSSVLGQFWDIAGSQQVVVGAITCSNCGGPIPSGALTCTHCGADIRTMASVPFLVERVQHY